MRLSLLLSLPIVVLALGLAAAPAQAAPTEELIQQVESLRSSLPPSDGAQIRALTVKLANLHFSQALNLNTNGTGDDLQQRIALHRARAIELFEGFLTGEHGRYAPPTGEQRAATRHNLAQLYTDTGKTDQAAAIWRDLVKESDYPSIAGEAALSLAEIEEAQDPASPAALQHFRQVLADDKRLDTRNYAHYRAAWILRNQGAWRDAIAELKESLWDSKGQVKEEVVNDLVAFYAASDIPAATALAYFQDLGEKTARPNLVTNLADAYVAAGRKPEALAALGKVVDTRASPLHVARYLEESYGVRDWTAFGRALAQAQILPLGNASAADRAETQKILKRLCVQLDAEKTTAPEVTPQFQGAVDAFLRWFPTDEDAFKMAASTIQAEKDAPRRVDRLQRFIGLASLKMTADDRLRLREQLIASLQGLGRHDEAAAAAGSLAADVKVAAEARRYRFVQASELYDGGKQKESLPLFQTLAKENAKDEFGLKSAMVAARIQGRSGDYAGALSTSSAFLAAVDASPSVKQSKEYQAIVEVRDNAEFEGAAAAGSTPAALASFKKFCLADEFQPKACANAETVALKVGDYESLLAVLRHEKKSSEVTQILEESARFADAARAREAELGPKASVTERLHVALLYEIAGAAADQNRLLDGVIVELETRPFASAAEAALVHKTLVDAGRMTGKALKLRWSDDIKCGLLDAQAAAGPVAKKDGDALLACKTGTGPGWAKVARERATALDAKQKRIAFYGSGSKRKFERRLAAINAEGDVVNALLPNAPHQAYLDLAAMAQNAYQGLAAEIEATPIPAEATPDMLPQIKKALADMADPFKAKAAAYGDLIAKETAQAAPATPAAQGPAACAPVAASTIQPYVQKLNNDPKNLDALSHLRDEFAKSGNVRVVAYFDGRLKETKEMH